MIHGAFLARLKDTNPQLVQSALASEKKTGLLMKCLPCWIIRLFDVAHGDRVSCLVSRVLYVVESSVSLRGRCPTHGGHASHASHASPGTS